MKLHLITTRRRAFTLIEMLVVSTVFSTVLALSVALIQSLMKLDRSAQSHSEMLGTVARLARVFRADARQAIKVEPRHQNAEAPQLQTLQFGMADSQLVQYEVLDRDVKRSEWENETLIRTDRFRLPRRGAWFESKQVEGFPWAACMLDTRSNSSSSSSAPRLLRINAAIGRDHRFEEVPER